MRQVAEIGNYLYKVTTLLNAIELFEDELSN